MSRNIPTNDEIYNKFTSFKDATGKLIDNKRITNDKFIEMLLNDFSLKEKIISYIAKDSETIKKLNNGGK